MTATSRSVPARTPPSGTAGAVAVDAPDRPWEPRWLNVARRRAAAWVEAHGFPTVKHEDWRYTKIDAALAVPLAAPPQGAVGDVDTLALADLPTPPLGGVRVVVVNGRVAAGLSSTGGALAPGMRVEPLADALHKSQGSLEQAWGWHADGYAHALRALNDAATLDGVLIELAAGALVEDPIEIVYASVPAPGAGWSHPRVVVVAGAGARATLVETYLSGPSGSSVTNAVTQVHLGQGAELEHCVLQGAGMDSFCFSSLEARLARGSRLSSRLLATGGRVGRHEVDVVLADEGAELSLDGLFLTGAGQHHDNPVLVDHAAPSCTSRQLYKGVVSGDGHGVFNGHIVVRPGADGTDAAQVNKNLLLSDRAEVDTRPRLEINADEVACSHGAAVGQLDPDALFYLRSRGVSEGEARAVLVSGFAREVLDRFGRGSIRGRAEELAMAAGLLALGEDGHGDDAVTAGLARSRPGGRWQ